MFPGSPQDSHRLRGSCRPEAAGTFSIVSRGRIVLRKDQESRTSSVAQMVVLEKLAIPFYQERKKKVFNVDLRTTAFPLRSTFVFLERLGSLKDCGGGRLGNRALFPVGTPSRLTKEQASSGEVTVVAAGEMVAAPCQRDGAGRVASAHTADIPVAPLDCQVRKDHWEENSFF